MLSASCIGVVPDRPAPTIKTGEISRTCPNGIDFHFFSWINQSFSPRKSSQQPLDQLASDCPLKHPRKQLFRSETRRSSEPRPGDKPREFFLTKSTAV